MRLSRLTLPPLLAAAVIVAPVAQAQQYHGTASASVRYDDNLFRLSPAVRDSRSASLRSSTVAGPALTDR